MSNEAVIAVFVRAYGVWGLVYHLPINLRIFLLDVFPGLLHGGALQDLFWWSYQFLWAVIYAVMVVSPIGFARLLVPRRWREAGSLAWPQDGFQSAVLGVLGVYLILMVVVAAIGGVTEKLAEWIGIPYRGFSFILFWDRLFDHLVRLIVGLHLVFGLKNILRAVLWFRTAGQR